MPTQASGGVLARVVHQYHQPTSQHLQQLRGFQYFAHIARTVFVGCRGGAVQGIQHHHSASGHHSGKVCHVQGVGQLERLQHHAQAIGQGPAPAHLPCLGAQLEPGFTFQCGIHHGRGFYAATKPAAALGNTCGKVKGQE